MARLPSKGFIIWSPASAVTFLSGVFLLLDRIKPLVGLQSLIVRSAGTARSRQVRTVTR